MLTRTDFPAPYSRPAPILYPYPVPSVYAFLVFVRLFPKPLAAYLIFVITAFLFATTWLALRVKRLTGKQLPEIAVWATLVLGFPLLFLFDRANIEGLIWVLVLLGLAAFTQKRPWIAAILWAIAASMKIFPAILFLLFLARRRYSMFVAAVAFVAVFTALALVGVGPSIHAALLDNARIKPFLLDNYILARRAPQFDHSLFMAIKQVGLLFLDFFGRGQYVFRAFKAALRVYNIVIPLGFALLYWFRLRKLPQLNQFMAYMLLAILLPYVSNEYTLVYLYLIWAAFLLFLLQDFTAGRVALPARTVGDILFSCAVIFVPLGYFGIPAGTHHVILIGAQIKTIFLLIILFAVIRYPMPSSLFGDLPADPEPEPAQLR